jgi:deoxyribonuclease V
MKINHPHRWDVTPREAIALQKSLSPRIIYDTPLDLEKVQLVAGVDVSVRDNVSTAAVVVLTYPDMTPVETVLESQPTPFPYIPGLLSFREGPALSAAFEQLKSEPDVFIFDGMGRIHPRGIGIASHMGLWLDRPTIGCGKSHLIGQYDTPGPEKGNLSLLSYKGETLGAVLRTRTNVKPVYISVGHRATLETALQVIMACTPRYRLPEPIRQAHNAAGKK